MAKQDVIAENPDLSLQIGRGQYEWSKDGRLTFHGVRGAYLWLDPSLKRLLLPLAGEIGRDLFSLLVARSSSIGTQSDYDDIIAKTKGDFRAGFLAWGEAVLTAGWGRFELPEYVPSEKRAVVVVRNAWELGLQKSVPISERWGCPFIQGKVLGIFSIGFETNCWADAIDYPGLGEEDVAFQVYPSRKTIESSLVQLRMNRMKERERELTREVQRKTQELEEARDTLRIHSEGLELLVAQQTAEIRAQNRALVDSREELSSILRTAPNLILNVGREGQIRFFNRWGGNVAPATIWELGLDSAETEKLKKALDRVFEERVAHEISVTFSGEKENSEYLLSLGPSDSTDHSASVTLVGVDITERRKLEEQLRHSQRLESVGLLAGGIAHDFNNILTAVLGSAQIAREILGEGSAIDDLINTIIKSSQMGATLVKELSIFSRKTFETSEVHDLNKVVQSVNVLLERTLPEQIELRLRLHPSSLPIKMGGGGQLEQVLLNLAINASEAMPQGGSITIRTSQREKEAKGLPERFGSYAVLTVEDTGSGMTAEVKEKIFDPFFTTKAMGRGTGLGLATSAGIIEKAGGFWEVNSELGRGSTFRVFLPLSAKCDLVKEQQPKKLAPQKGTERILLVEDNQSVRQVNTRYLLRCGYQVQEATDGEEALVALKQSPSQFDLIVTDIVMPRMNGVQLACGARKLCPKLPILFVSGYSDTVLPSQEEHVLPKPFSLVDLGRRIREILEAQKEMT